MKTILLATHNNYKIKEIDDVIDKSLFNVLSLKDFSFPDVEETGTTFLENACLKGKALSDLYPNTFVIADDSGLCVSALDNKPGVYSSSFGGEEGNHQLNNEHMIKTLKSLPEGTSMSAYYKCIIVIFFNGEFVNCSTGILYGKMITEPRGENGFGYDNLFIPDRCKKTLAEMTLEEKNKISHRFKAVKQIIKIINKL